MRLLQDIVAKISDAGGNIISSGSRADRRGSVNMRFMVQLSDIGRLDSLLNSLRGVDGVLEARRALSGEAIRPKSERNR